MKVALCLSGQPRNLARGHAYIKGNVLDTCNPDVYIHFWEDRKMVGKQFINAGGHEASDTVPDNMLELIEDLYYPQACVAEPQRQFSEKNYNDRRYPGIKPFNSLSQRYSIQQSMNLCTDSGIAYDAVIRMRFDWAITTPIDLDTLDISHLRYPGDCPHPGGINDQFAIGVPEHMRVYADLYDHIDEYYNDDQIVFCDEILLGYHLRKQEIPHKSMKIGYGLIRAGTVDTGRAI